MGKFLNSKLSHEVIENLNRTIMSNMIKFVIKNLPKNQSPGLDDFTAKF
jgi:hypothetical protein